METINKKLHNYILEELDLGSSLFDIETIKQNILERFRRNDNFDENIFDIEIQVDNNNEIIIIPKNLYSLLWVESFYVNINDVEGLEEYETPMGTYAYKDNTCLFSFKKPLDFIQINLTESGL